MHPKDPADLPEFDRVMRGLVGVDPDEVEDLGAEDEPSEETAEDEDKAD